MELPRRGSKSRVLRDHLLDQIRQHRIPFGGRLPSETALMQKFDLSRSTVRQVLSELTVQGLIERQQGRGTFRVGENQPSHSIRPSMLIGVWFNWPSGPLFGPIAEGIREELRKWGYHAVFEVGGLETGAECRGVESLISKGMDGFIVSPSTNLADEHGPLIEIIRRNMPLVLVDLPLAGYETDLVTTNSEFGAETVVSHLVGLGHRRIAFIGFTGPATIDDRLRGYRQTMEENGIEIDEMWVQVSADVAADFGRRASRSLLALPPDRRPTAIFGATDVLAESAAQIAQELGLKVPADVSIAGFDDVNIDPARPGWLTTYAQPKHRIGQYAARQLMKRLQNRPRANTHILLEGRLVERASTAPPPATTGPLVATERRSPATVS